MGTGREMGWARYSMAMGREREGSAMRLGDGWSTAMGTGNEGAAHGTGRRNREGFVELIHGGLTSGEIGQEPWARPDGFEKEDLVEAGSVFHFFFIAAACFAWSLAACLLGFVVVASSADCCY